MNDDEEMFDQAEQYVLSRDDLKIISAIKLLLWKTARSSLVNPRQLGAIAQALQVFDSLPAVTTGCNIEIQVTGPRRMFGSHEIFHWWNVQIDGGSLLATSQGHFYRPETGGDTFTSMVWRASPGAAAEYRDYLTSIAIVDDAQPYDCEVADIDLSEEGYSLEVLEEGEDLCSANEDDEDEEMAEPVSPKVAVQKLAAFGVECVWANREMTQLHSIDLNQEPLPDAAYQLIEHIPSLSTLEARNSSISDGTLRFIEHLEMLEWLCLRGTSVTDAGLQHLQGLVGLKHLDLVSTKVSGPGLMYLRGLPNLRDLHVSGFLHHDKYLATLRRELPQCRIYLN